MLMRAQVCVLTRMLRRVLMVAVADEYTTTVHAEPVEAPRSE
jgi:hypothetical protein